MYASSFVNRPFAIRAVVAAALVVSSVLLAQLLWLLVDRPINSPLFLMAMILAAWLCGFRLAVVTAIASGLAIKFFFVVPLYQFIGDRQAMVRIVVFVLEGILLAWLIQRLRVVNEKIEASREELRALTGHQRTLLENEQKRIAREVHDELGQTLTGMKMDIHHLKWQLGRPESEFPREAANEHLDELSGTIDETIASVRRITAKLRPSILDDFGLVAAMEWQAEEFSKRTKLACSFRSDTDSIDIGPDAATAVFRIFQEALTNIARHADATRFEVDIETLGERFVLTVRDDGKGIAPAALNSTRSLGLLGARERSRLIGAELRIDRAKPCGTQISLSVPLPDHSQPPGKEIA